MSEKKLASNRSDAQKSTGPCSVAGKQKVGQNATRHGILSTHLVLVNESREEFDLLLGTLQQEMSPVGLIEQTLVERIAVAIWRQRRLVCAEAAELELKQCSFHGKDFAAIINSIGILTTDKRLKDAVNFSSLPESEQYVGRIETILPKVIDLVREGHCANLDEIRKFSPDVYEELIEMVGCDRASLDKNLAELIQKGAETAKVTELYIKAVISCYRKTHEHMRIKQLVQLYRDSAQMHALVDAICRYQSTLDNELYKAMLALREAQNCRMSLIEADARCLDGSEVAA